MWEDNLRTRLLVPLSTTHTALYAEEAIVFRTAAGHVEDPQTKQLKLSPQWTLPRSNGPAGSAILAAPQDLVKFARIFLNDGRTQEGTRIVSAETIAAMTAPTLRTLGMPSMREWGLGVINYDFAGTRVIGHNGHLRGQTTYLRIVPSHNLVLAASANGGGAQKLCSELLDELIAEVTGAVPPRVPAPPQVPSTVDIAPLIGLYTGPLAHWRVDPAEGGIDVTLLPTPEAVRLGAIERTYRLVHYEKDVFVTIEREDGAHWTLTFVDGGRYLHNSRAHPRVAGT